MIRGALGRNISIEISGKRFKIYQKRFGISQDLSESLGNHGKACFGEKYVENILF